MCAILKISIRCCCFHTILMLKYKYLQLSCISLTGLNALLNCIMFRCVFYECKSSHATSKPIKTYDFNHLVFFCHKNRPSMFILTTDPCTFALEWSIYFTDATHVLIFQTHLHYTGWKSYINWCEYGADRHQRGTKDTEDRWRQTCCMWGHHSREGRARYEPDEIMYIV